MTKPDAARCHATNWRSYNDTLKKRGSVLIWLDKDMAWRAPEAGHTGRPPLFFNAAIQFCLMVKGQEIGTVTGHGAFDTHHCHTAILEYGGTASIPIRKNGRLWKEDCPAAMAWNDILRATRRLGLTLWKC